MSFVLPAPPGPASSTDREGVLRASTIAATISGRDPQVRRRHVERRRPQPREGAQKLLGLARQGRPRRRPGCQGPAKILADDTFVRLREGADGGKEAVGHDSVERLDAEPLHRPRAGHERTEPARPAPGRARCSRSPDRSRASTHDGRGPRRSGAPARCRRWRGSRRVGRSAHCGPARRAGGSARERARQAQAPPRACRLRAAPSGLRSSRSRWSRAGRRSRRTAGP